MEEQKGMVSGFAIASLVMGVLSYIQLFGLEKPVAAIVFGALALKRMNVGAVLKGRKLAVAGIVLGAIGTILTVVLTIMFWPRLLEMQQQMQTSGQVSDFGQ